MPDLLRSGSLTLLNTSDELVLCNASPAIVDTVIYEGGVITGTDWIGARVNPYSESVFGIEGQIIYRKRDQVTGRPIADTDTVADWAQTSDDNINGKKVLYSGWDLDRYFFAHQVTQTANITYVVAPDAMRHSDNREGKQSKQCGIL